MFAEVNLNRSEKYNLMINFDNHGEYKFNDQIAIPPNYKNEF